MKSVLLFVTLLISALSLPMDANAAWQGYTIGDVNMRSGPGVRYRVKAVVPADESVYVHRCLRSWCNVTWHRKTGWVSRRYLSVRRAYYDHYDDEPYYDEPYYDEPIYIDRIYIDRPHRHYRKYRHYKKKRYRKRYKKRYKKRKIEKRYKKRPRRIIRKKFRKRLKRYERSRDYKRDRSYRKRYRSRPRSRKRCFKKPCP